MNILLTILKGFVFVIYLGMFLLGICLAVSSLFFILDYFHKINPELTAYFCGTCLGLIGIKIGYTNLRNFIKSTLNDE